jgi:hypothetical protein
LRGIAKVDKYQLLMVRLSSGGDTCLADAIAIRTRESTTALSTISKGLGLQIKEKTLILRFEQASQRVTLALLSFGPIIL